MPSLLKDKAAIVGVGETEYSRDAKRSLLRLFLEGGAAAIKDAGLAPKDIDGLVTGGTTMAPGGYPSMDDLMSNFGMKDVKYTSCVRSGGASNCGSLLGAVMAVASGVCNNVLSFMGWLGSSQSQRRPAAMEAAAQAPPAPAAGHQAFQIPFGMVGSPAAVYVHHVLRYIHEYGDISPALGAIAVAGRKHALLNPLAVMKTPLTMEEYLNSPFLVWPIRRWDFSLQTDGVAAFVVTSAERARDFPHRPVYIMGAAEGHPDSPQLFASRPKLTSHGMEKCADRAFAMAGVTPKDMDFAQLYDGFTYVVLLQIESIFCGKGEGNDFCKDGQIELGGKLPVNTSGGLCSEAHIWGWNMINEAVRQLRGDCGPRQVKDAEIGLVTGFGDMFDASLAILRR